MATSKRSKSKRSKRSKSKTSKRSESKASKRSRRSGSKNRTRRSRSRAKQRTIKGRENYIMLFQGKPFYQAPGPEPGGWTLEDEEDDHWRMIATCVHIQTTGLDVGKVLDRDAKPARIHPRFWTPEEREQFVAKHAQELPVEDVD